MALTQRAYRNPDAGESENSPFTRIAQVRASSLAERHRNLLVAMLYKNRFGDELWMSTESICVVMGRVCYRRKTAATDTRGRALGPCERISRRAVQRLIDEVVAMGVLSQVHGANEHVPHGGGKKFRHTATYRLNPDKLAPRQTHEEYVEARDRARARHRVAMAGEHKGPQPVRTMPAPPPPAPATAPAPQPQRVAARLTRQERRMLEKTYQGLLLKLHRPAPAVAAPQPEPMPPERDPWLKILDALKNKIHQHSFETWLRPTRGLREADGVLFVRIPTAQFQHVGDKYAELIAEALDDLGLPFTDVKFVTPESPIPAEADAARHREFLAAQREALARACKLLSTSRRTIALEDGIVALRLANLWREDDEPKGDA